MDEDYTFPFNTCEKVSTGIVSQPYSAFVNGITCLIILFFLIKTKKRSNLLLLMSIFGFQLFHFFSHANHIEGSFIQTNGIHIFAYFINIAFFYCLYSYTKIPPHSSFVFFIVSLVVLDIYSLFYLPTIIYVSTQTVILASILLYYYSFLPTRVQTGVYQILFIAFVLVWLVVNEIYNCKKMLNLFPDFPFHIWIEITAVLFFYLISRNFYNLWDPCESQTTSIGIWDVKEEGMKGERKEMVGNMDTPTLLNGLRQGPYRENERVNMFGIFVIWRELKECGMMGHGNERKVWRDYFLLKRG